MGHKVWCEFTTEIPKRAMANQTTFRDFAIPDTVTKIGREAFMGSLQIRRVYIPKSVVTIEPDAFKGCANVEIFCEGEPQEGWVSGVGTDIEQYSVVTPEDDAFNFHRSGGSFTSTTVEREVVRERNWNPDGRPVHTNVPRTVLEDWTLFRVKYLSIVYHSEKPSFAEAYSMKKNMQQAIDELTREHKEFYGIHVLDWVDCYYNYGYDKKYGCHSLPSVIDYDREVVIYEPAPDVTYEALKSGLERAFREALSA